MPERIENKMVVDSEWNNIYEKEPSEIIQEKGYHELGTGVFVSENDAYEYALECCLNGKEEEQKEFEKFLVEWFYSGNWIKE